MKNGMKNELYLEEWKINSIVDSLDRFDNKIKSVSIGGVVIASQIPLYDNDLALLKTILGCDESKLTGKNITAVNQDRVTKAIGYQGLYIPLYYRDGSSKLISESELCELLESNTVVRTDADGKEIISYEVPTKSDKRGL